MLVKSGLSLVYDDPWTVVDWTGWISGGLLCSKQESGINLNLFLDMSWKILFFNFTHHIGCEIPNLLLCYGWWFYLVLAWLFSWSLCWTQEVVIIGLTWWVSGLVKLTHDLDLKLFLAFYKQLIICEINLISPLVLNWLSLLTFDFIKKIEFGFNQYQRKSYPKNKCL